MDLYLKRIQFPPLRTRMTVISKGSVCCNNACCLIAAISFEEELWTRKLERSGLI